MTNTAAYEALEEIVDYLTGIPAWFLATIDESDSGFPPRATKTCIASSRTTQNSNCPAGSLANIGLS